MKYLRLKKASELAGKRVRTLRELSNGLGTIPAGTIGTITNGRHVRDGKLNFEADKCECCGFAFRVSGLSYTDLELIDAQF